MSKVSNNYLMNQIEDTLDMPCTLILAQIEAEESCPGICKTCHDVLDNIEPDQQKGYCDECNTASVVSYSILLGVI